ncbi:hypothetical protein ACFY1V_12985 [Streptomyces sp. NPDC001255]|uniref:hypothetical protein n=1 Tax=Streptomyces sp. NPDC001255 TaxID=3364550 RepID=UPI0036A79413
MRAPAVYGLSFDPGALTDLLQAPRHIRDLALTHLQGVVTAERPGRPLTGDLDGHRKLAVGTRKDYRIVFGLRPAPTGSAHSVEAHVVAVRPRADVYFTVGQRLGMRTLPLSARAHAARSRSPQLTPRPQKPARGASALPPRPASQPVAHGRSR